MKYLLDVPYYSQHRDVNDENWRKNSCAVTCLKMVMEFGKNSTKEQIIPTIDELIKEGVIIGAHTSSSGWIHAGIVRLAHNYGFLAYNEEFKSVEVHADTTFSPSKYLAQIERAGIEKIISTIRDGSPVIVSCHKKWSEEGTSHQVVLTGFEIDETEDNPKITGFYYHEPDREGEEGKNCFVDIETFQTHWRKFAIFINNIR